MNRLKAASTLVFVRGNDSQSLQGTLCALYYQIQQLSAKLVRVTAGEIFKVAADLTRASPTFERWLGVML